MCVCVHVLCVCACVVCVSVCVCVECGYAWVRVCVCMLQRMCVYMYIYMCVCAIIYKKGTMSQMTSTNYDQKLALTKWQGLSEVDASIHEVPTTAGIVTLPPCICKHRRNVLYHMYLI